MQQDVDIELIGGLRDSARRVLDDHCRSEQLHRYIDQLADPGVLWRSAAELGWTALAVPEEHGGIGAGIAEIAVLQEELGRCLAPVPFLSTVLVSRALSLWPHTGSLGRWLPRLAQGALVGTTLCAGDDANLTAIREGDHYRFSGECLPVLATAQVEALLVRATTPAGPVLALLEKTAAVRLERLPVADVTRDVVRLSCQDAPVPVDQVLAGPHVSVVSEQILDEARILLASDCIGGAEAILEMTIEYLKTRTQFGKPIGSFQALKHRCANHKVALEANRRLVQRARLEREVSQRALWASLAKFSAADCYVEIAGDCIQMHGGIGFTWQHDAHLFLKRALFNQFLCGDSTALQDRAAELLMSGNPTRE